MPKLKKSQLAGVNIHWRLYPFEDFLDGQAALGLKNIELWAGSPHFLLGREGFQDCAPVKEAASRRGLDIPVLLCESVTYPFTLCCSVQVVLEKGLSYFKNAVLAAKALGAGIVVVSCAGGLYDKGKELAVSRAVEALKIICKAAEEQGVVIAVETLTPDQSFVINTLPELRQLLAEVNSPAVKACLDICAMRTAGETIDQWFEALGSDIVHIHFTDGRPAGRLVWGEGLHPLDEYLEKLSKWGYEGCLGLDINVRGNWFDPALVDEKKGFTGASHVPQNYWFCPKAADEANVNALSAYLEG